MQQVFDSHFHIIDPRFPLIANNGYLPEPFTASDYQEAVSDFPVTGGAVVSGSFQGFDQQYLLEALQQLGPGFVGVTNAPADISDVELRGLAAQGVRAVRFNLFRGGSEGAEQLLDLGRRAWDVAHMHSELYVDAATLPELEATILQLPLVSIDHLGMSPANRDCLLRLVENGVRVKATGFGRVSVDVASTLTQINRANPKALMFGTDLPGTRAPRPFSPEDLVTIEAALGADALPGVLHDNAVEFYRLG